MAGLFAGTQKQGESYLSKSRRWARSHPQLATQHGIPTVVKRGAPPGSRLDPGDAVILAVVADYGGLQRVEMLDTIGIDRSGGREEAALNRLRYRIGIGHKLIKGEGGWARVPDELRPERLRAMPLEVRREHCLRALRGVKPF
jgi:hypothetical protein